MGELVAARQALRAALLAPTPAWPSSGTQPATLCRDILLANLRCAEKGAALGPSGLTTELDPGRSWQLARWFARAAPTFLEAWQPDRPRLLCFLWMGLVPLTPCRGEPCLRPIAVSRWCVCFTVHWPGPNLNLSVGGVGALELISRSFLAECFSKRPSSQHPPAARPLVL